MATLLTTLRTELQEKIGSTSNIKADTTKQKNALNRALDKMQLRNNWMFTIRKTTFDYVPDILEYSVANYLGLTDLKDLYRVAGEYITNNDPKRFPGGEAMGLHIKDNDRFLSFRLNGGKTILIDGLTALAEDGTWSAVGDAANLVADGNEFKDGSGSLKFNIDEDSDAEDYAGIQNTTKGAKDLTSFLDRSYFILDVYMPTAADITNIQLFWGSDTSNYWSLTATAPVDSGSFKDGWNVVKFKWTAATKTLSPDVENIDYLELRANYSSGISDQTAFRFSNLRLDIREQVDLEYFSKNMVKDTSGTYQSRFSAGTDLFLGDDELKVLLLELAYYEIIRNTKTLDKGEISRAKDELEEMFRQAIQDYGYVRSKGARRVNIKL